MDIGIKNDLNLIVDIPTALDRESSLARKHADVLESEGEHAVLRKIVKGLRQSLPSLKPQQAARWTEGDSAPLVTEPHLEMLQSLSGELRQTKKNSDKSKAADEQLTKWLLENRHGTSSSPRELQLLYATLLLNGKNISRELFWNLWNAATDSFVALKDQLDPPEGAEVPLGLGLISACELRWLALAITPDIHGSHRLAREARRGLSQWLDDAFADQGVPSACDLNELPEALRALGRIWQLAEICGESPLRKADHKAFRRFLKTCCRLVNRQRSTGSSESPVPWDLLASWSKLVSPASQAALTKGLRTIAANRDEKKTKSLVPSGKPSLQSDDAQWAVLRSSWSPQSDFCLVTHHTKDVTLDLRQQGEPLLAGCWDVEVTVDGKTFRATDAWNCVCWFSDADGDYIELQQKISDDVILERQLFLSRTDQFAILAEVLHAPEDAATSVRSVLPLSTRLTATRDKQTREMQLRVGGKKRAGRVYPLSLAQETTHKTDGSTQTCEAGIELQQQSTGSIYAPTIIDWHPDRLRMLSEWRTLTVTEAQIKCSADEAGGFRFRCRDQHLMLYRSLRKPYSPRAILGHHTMHETVFAHFDYEGDVLPILLVE